MKSNSTMRALALAALPALAVGAFAFSVTPGTVVGIDATTNTLVEYDFSGNINETLSVSGMPSTFTGVGILGNRVFLSDVSGAMGEVNLSTGAMFGLFGTGSNEGMGDNGSDLLALNYFAPGPVDRYNTVGGFLGSSNTNGGNTGVDGDSRGVWVCNYDDGNVYGFDYSSNMVASFASAAGRNANSGLGYDSGAGVVWVASGFGDDMIRAYSTTGALLTSFGTQYDWINGLDVVPVPEPVSMVALGLGVLALSRKRRKA